MRLTDDITARMKAGDPAAEAIVSTSRKQADLERILSTPAPHPRPRSRAALPRRRLLIGAALATAAATAVAVLPQFGTSGSAHAATPPPLAYVQVPDPSSGPARLERIAAAIEHNTARPGPAGLLEYRDWSLFTRDDKGDVRSEVVAEDHTLTIAADGTATQKRRWDGDRTTRTEPAGTSTYAGAMPTDPADLATWLRRSTPAVGTASGTDEAIGSILRQRVLDPAERAALLRLIAAVPDLRFDGQVTDRAGRQGLAFSAESNGSGLPTRYTFIVDPPTGQVIGQEAMLTTTAGKLNVPVPSVISYTAYLKSEHSGP